MVQVRHRPNRVVWRNHLSRVAIRVAIGAIGSSGCTGQVIHISYSEKIGQALASKVVSVEWVFIGILFVESGLRKSSKWSSSNGSSSEFSSSNGSSSEFSLLNGLRRNSLRRTYRRRNGLRTIGFTL